MQSKPKRVEASEYAASQWEEYYRYLAEQSGSYEVADRWFAGLQSLIASLGEDWSLYQRLDDSEERGANYHSHRVIFRESENVVYVVALQHMARKDLS